MESRLEEIKRQIEAEMYIDDDKLAVATQRALADRVIFECPTTTEVADDCGQ